MDVCFCVYSIESTQTLKFHGQNVAKRANNWAAVERLFLKILYLNPEYTHIGNYVEIEQNAITKSAAASYNV